MLLLIINFFILKLKIIKIQDLFSDNKRAWNVLSRSTLKYLYMSIITNKKPKLKNKPNKK